MTPIELDELKNLCDVSRETIEKLDLFRELFLKWNKSINLVAPSTIDSLWERHFLDSVQLWALNQKAEKWIDLGSGGGFPGIIISILLGADGHIDLVESNHKKAAFLRQALLQLDVRGTIHAMRIEDCVKKLGNYDAVSARALTNLSNLFKYSEKWLTQGAVGWFHKGRDYSQEIEIARRRWDFNLVLHSSKVEENSYILEISKLTKK